MPEVRTVCRYEIQVSSSEWTSVRLRGKILHVGCRNAHVVEFWATHEPVFLPIDRHFRVFGTGHALPGDLVIAHVGTAIAPGGKLVWHLFERMATAIGDNT